MINIVIAKDEKRFKDALTRLLREERYAISSNLDGQEGIITIAEKGSNKNIDSLANMIIALEDSLYKEKRGVLYKSILETVEKPLIEHILERTEGNQLKAARILGINRNTIRTKIKKLGIDVSRWKV